MERNLKRVSVRFSERTHALIKREAELEAVSLNQYMREAALARAYLAIGQRAEDLGGVHGDLLGMAREVVDAEDSRRRSGDLDE